MKLVIPAIPPSPNRILGKHWSVKAGEKNAWVLLVRGQVLPKPVQKFRCRVAIRLFHPRQYDKDNLYASVKPVVDALKHWRLIRDDSSEWLDLDVQQEKCPKKFQRTEIYIERLQP